MALGILHEATARESGCNPLTRWRFVLVLSAKVALSNDDRPEKDAHVDMAVIVVATLIITCRYYLGQQPSRTLPPSPSVAGVT